VSVSCEKIENQRTTRNTTEYEEHQTNFGRVGMISKQAEVAGSLTLVLVPRNSFVFLIFSQETVTSCSKRIG